MKKIVPGILTVFFLLISLQKVQAWGFWAHQRINRIAVFTLPPEMLVLYKKNIEFLTEHAVDPDKRRYAVEGEAPRHYIDIDHYGENPFNVVPELWSDAVQKFTEDTLQAYGIVPWHISRSYSWLVSAFREGDVDAILKLSADIGHYIADGNVPLHTTENYNGQLTGQKGIHGLWESRLPEVFGEGYDYLVGKAQYLDDILDEAWSGVREAHYALDSVFNFEKILTEQIGSDQKYSFENRNGRLVKTFSKAFCTSYHDMLDGQVERRARISILRVGSVWYSAWIDAGQPNLKELIKKVKKGKKGAENKDEKIEEEKENNGHKLKIIDRESSDLLGMRDVHEMLFGECEGHGMGVGHGHGRPNKPHTQTAQGQKEGLWPLRMRDL